MIPLSANTGRETEGQQERETDPARDFGGEGCPMLGAEALETIARRAGLLAFGSSRWGLPSRGLPQWRGEPTWPITAAAPRRIRTGFPLRLARAITPANTRRRAYSRARRAAGKVGKVRLRNPSSQARILVNFFVHETSYVQAEAFSRKGDLGSNRGCCATNRNLRRFDAGLRLC